MKSPGDNSELSDKSEDVDERHVTKRQLKKQRGNSDYQ